MQPMPVPQQVGVEVATFDDGSRKVVTIHSGPCGQWVTFLDPEAAKDVAAQLVQRANEALMPALVVPAGARARVAHSEPDNVGAADG